MTLDPGWMALRDFPPVVPIPGEPDHTPLGARLRERTEPMAVNDASYGYAHAHLCEAMMRGGIELSQAFDPDDPWEPFEPVLDPEACPAWALPWLAQLAGVTLTGSMTEDEQRAAIHELAAQTRGTRAIIRAAAARYLTGSKEVVFRERDGGNPYALEVVTRTGETPDPALVEAAIRAQIPAAIILDFHPIVGWDYQEWTETAAASSDPTYAEQAAHYADYAALRDRNET
jgi:hypothetical protein